jgi:septum formation inhibitor-activating ATPase MinD
MPTAVSIRLSPKWDADTVKQNLVTDRRLGVDALLAPIRPRNADDVGPDFYRQIIQVLQTTHDVVILDCSVNYLDPLLGVAFSLADEILFVTTLAGTSVQGMARALTELFTDPTEGGLGIPREKVGIVANQVIHNVGMGKDKLLRAALGAPLVGQIPAEHDEVLIQTNSNRMDNLLKHPRLGPAYYKLATTCLPGWRLAPLTVEASQAAAAPQAAQPEQKKGGFFRR